MSRSYRHVPITGITTADSEKRDKTLARRAWRRALKQWRDILLREISNPWSMDKDGKYYHQKYKTKDMSDKINRDVWGK